MQLSGFPHYVETSKMFRYFDSQATKCPVFSIYRCSLLYSPYDSFRYILMAITSKEAYLIDYSSWTPFYSSHALTLETMKGSEKEAGF